MYKIGLLYQQFSNLFPSDDATAESTPGYWQSDYWQGDFWQAVLPPPPTSGALNGAIGGTTNAGDGVGSDGDTDVGGPTARAAFDVDGTGIRIGIISDSFDAGGANLAAVTAEEDDGDLPSTVTVLSDAITGTDEGRAMAELVHEIAPGAQIYFATMGSNESASAQAVASLQAAGCSIIVDDVSWSTEPFFQDGSPLQTAIETATASGVSYFTSAGNQADNYYQGTVGTFPTVEITSSTGGAIEIDLQWTQPFASFPTGATGSAYSLGWTLYFHGTNIPVPNGSSTNDEDRQNPVQNASVALPSPGSYDLVITDNGTGGLVTTDTYKVIVLAGDAASVSLSGPAGIGTGSGTVFGHELPSSVNAVGAVNAAASTDVEPYSAYGAGDLYFAANGSALGAPVSQGQPSFLAPDNIETSVSGFGAFAGTSAAAPNAAAVGALLLQINPNLTPTEIQAALEATASTANLIGNTAQFGAGLINADAAAALLYGRVIAWNHASGNWGTSADWQAAGTPGTTSYVTLGDNLGALAADYIVTLDASAGTVDTLTVGNAGSIATALSIASGGSLIVAGGATVSHDGQVTVAASGSLQVDGLLQLDDITGASATLSLLSNAAVTAGSFDIIGGAATVAAGANLAVAGTGTLGEGDDGTLLISGRATVNSDLIVSQTGQLAIGPGGSLDVGGTLSLQAGDAAMIGVGGTLSVGELSGGIFFESRGHLTIDNGGELVVSNGASSYLTGAIFGLETTIIDPVAHTLSHVLLSGVAFAGQTLSYSTANGALSIQQGSTLVAKLGFGTTLGLTQASFSTAEVAGELEINIACYLRGTRIATRAGEVPVEALRIGDEILTASGALRPIRWIGRRSYTREQAAAHRSLRPIRIAAGALGPLRPRRDLLVSPQHALLLRDPADGHAVLVPAAQLVNGANITREPAAAICYFHLELAGHDVILAEGQPAETFVDRDSRAAFANAGEYAQLYPGAAAEVAPFCAPRIEGGPVLARIRAIIEEWGGLLPGRLTGSVDRVAADWVEGWAHDPAAPAGPVLLEILVDDAVAGVLLADQFRADLQAMNGGYCAFFFAMPGAWRIGRESRLAVRRVLDRREVPRTPASLSSDGVALIGDATEAYAPLPA